MASEIRSDVILAEMRTGVASILREMESMKQEQRRMHQENADRVDETNDRLDLANDRLNQINGKVQKHDGLIDTLREDMRTVRMKVHALSNDLQKFIADALNAVHRAISDRLPSDSTLDDDKKAPSRNEVKRYLIVIGLVITGTVSFLKFLDMLKLPGQPIP